MVVSVLGWLGWPGLGYEANSSASVLRAALFGTSSITRGAAGGGWFAKNWRGGGLEVGGESEGSSLMIMIVIISNVAAGDM